MGRRWNVGLDTNDSKTLFNKPVGHRYRGRLSQIVNVRLECETQAPDYSLSAEFALESQSRFADFSNNPFGFSVVNEACPVNQLRFLGILRDNEPRINGNTMTPDPGSRMED